jgi:crotonobetainyl-CoA:carnitine CoA-transferase CaiB-like acyl-CoA transferase
VDTPNTPIRFTETATGVYRRPPKLGEHTDEILAEIDALLAEQSQHEHD